jgi:hypothetical protein
LNRFKICFRSKVIFTSGFYFRFRSRHLSFRCRPMSDNIGNVIFGSGILENVGVAVGIPSPSVSAQKLFPLPVSWPTFEFPMSGNVGFVILESGVVENVEVANRIASLCLSIQHLCQHACLASAILKFACRSTCHVTNFKSLGFF